jgi:hypothetical protein
MNPTRKTESDLLTIIFLSVLIAILILTAMCPTPAAAYTPPHHGEESGAQDIIRVYAPLVLRPSTGAHAQAAKPAQPTPAEPTPDTPAPIPDDPAPIPDDPEPDPVNPCGQYSEDGPHPCNDHADPNPPQDGERRQQ